MNEHYHFARIRNIKKPAVPYLNPLGRSGENLRNNGKEEKLSRACPSEVSVFKGCF
jgi:hypothetical protein